jgi:hypothetical protein
VKRGVRQAWKRRLVILVCVLGLGGVVLGVASCDLFNKAPLAGFTIGPSTAGTVPFPVNLSAVTSTDPDGDDLEYAWQYGDGSPEGAGESVSHLYTVPGTYTIVLTVTDSHGESSQAQRTVYVAAAAPAGPTARFTVSPTSGTSPLAVTVNASGSTYSEAAIASYEWAFGDGVTGAGRTASHTYVSSSSRSYTITLTVRAADGTTGTATNQVAITTSSGGGTPVAGSPSARFVITFPDATNTTVAPVRVDLNPAESQADTGRTIVAYAWSFGDGYAASSVPATVQRHTYTTSLPSQVFSVTLVVVDNVGASNSITKTVSVENYQPVAGFEIHNALTTNATTVAPVTGVNWKAENVTFTGVQTGSTKVWIRSLAVTDPNWTRTQASPSPATKTGTPTAPAYANHSYSYDPEGQAWNPAAPTWFPSNGAWGIDHFEIDWGEGSIDYNISTVTMNAGVGHEYEYTGSLVKTIKVTVIDRLGAKASWQRTITFGS